ncbi:MAG: helix-hairpin-helix domain-containing protein, partial [Lachnospiraceae bacterium]|nr:helix-hairpin-helix domain-containing protein [Lachnospiraceae bacterium]
TGCKLAVVDEIGNVLDTAVIFPTAPTNPAKIEQAKKVLRSFISKYHVTLISCGNGTASRESEQFISELLKEIPEQVSYLITNEAGASVYSASALATEEFPNFDVGQRSAVSIARRAQDPLAELVKIDPKSIGVGQYQHDVDEKKLKETLGGVVESCVNEVGVDLNTASAVLLEYISGITKATAKNIVMWREENGRFRNRKQLLKVKGLGPKAFQQSAGFLRISDGENPLDNTAVHPESYGLADAILKACSVEAAELHVSDPVIRLGNTEKLEKEFQVGAVTVQEIVRELNAASRDPRADAPAPILRQDVLAMEDLKEGMVLKGTVRNIVDFGAFVDIGVHEDGLVHISKLTAKKFVKHPLEVVSVGDIVEVKVISIDLAKKRIGLSMVF